jgi:hypothetical protein
VNFNRNLDLTNKELEYKSRLLIYDAGDARTTWISFWKAVALLQCGTTLVFAVPPLWKNENQPDPNLRKAQAILGKFLFINIFDSCRILSLLLFFPFLSSWTSLIPSNFYCRPISSSIIAKNPALCILPVPIISIHNE